jgi:serine peptidase DegS
MDLPDCGKMGSTLRETTRRFKTMNTLRYVVLPAVIGALVGLAVIAALTMARGASPTSYADAVATASPSVVNIYTTKIVRTRRLPICDLPQFRELCEGLRIADPRVQNALGSGVIVRRDGYIVTNAHVIEGADEILVAFHDGQTASAEVVGEDPETDLAVVRVRADDLPAIALGSSDSARVGDVVLAIGNPFGIGQTVSLGIIGAKGRYGLSASPYEDFIQTDAAINPGNSGGALIDANGRLIGINSLFFSRSGGSQGIGFAVPVQLAMSVLEQIVRTGRVVRGWLGMQLADADADSGGLLVQAVLPDSPAADAGLMPGDRIVAVDGIAAGNRREMLRQIAMTEPGSRVRLSVTRDGRPLTLNATAGTRPTPD